MDNGDILFVYKNGISLRCRGGKIVAVVASSTSASLPRTDRTAEKPTEEDSRSTDNRPTFKKSDGKLDNKTSDTRRTEFKSDSKTGQSDAKSKGYSGHSNAEPAGTIERANVKSKGHFENMRSVPHEKPEVSRNVAHGIEAGHTGGLHEAGMHMTGLGGMHAGGFGGLGGLGGIHLGGFGKL